MNIGIYVKSLGDEEQLKLGIEAIENGISNNTIDDASIFYDSVHFSPLFFPCGLFNSTELWSFSGKLFTFSIDCLKTAKNIVNKIDLYYCYGWEKECNVLKLLDLLSDSNVKIVCKTKEDKQNIYRLTGIQSYGSLDELKILDIGE